MRRYLLLRIAQSLVALLAISIITFGLSHLSGSPVDSMLPDDAGPEEAERLTREWGLDRPIHVQYFTFLGNALQGNLGDSLKWRGYTALEVVMERLPATIQLGGFAVLVSTIIAIPIGVLAGVYKDTPFDSAGKLVALLGQAMPNFWLGIVLIWIFAVKLDWLPTSGKGGISHIILPAITMGWFQVAAIMRLVRSSMLDTLDSEYVNFARVKGIPERKVVWKHCLRNAAVAPLTYFGVISAAILVGSITTETVFAWPGLGRLILEATLTRDYAVVQAVVLLFAGMYIVGNLVVDILYAYLDPRIRFN